MTEAKNASDLDRRTFLSTGLALAGAGLTRSSERAVAARRAVESGINRATDGFERYEAVVPDTLDLSERAKLGIHQLTEQVSEADGYEMYSRQFFMYAPPRLRFFVDDLGCCQPKALEAMAMLRLMSGSEENRAREAGMIAMMLSNVGEDGLYWIPPSPNKPWLGPEEYKPYAYVHGQARMMRAMVAWHQYSGHPSWKAAIDRMVAGLGRIVERRGDYAYIPIHGWMEGEYFRSCYSKKKGWKDTREPTSEREGEEGSLFNHQGHTPGVLANWYRSSGNEAALRLSGELVRFLTKPRLWDLPGADDPNVFGYSGENAHWTGHFHGHVNTLRAILEYASAVNDARLKEFVRSGYEWARSRGIARIGLFDEQGCGTARMIGLAVKLTDAGVGDYWEDVDQYIRNNGSELQLASLDEIRKLCEGPRQTGAEGFTEKVARAYGVPRLYPDRIVAPLENADRVAERSVGGFGRLQLPFGGQAVRKSIICCNSHGNMGLFYAWEGALRYADGTARVNLLINRASPWLDVESHLPYEGRVVIRNKAAREAWIRVPLWVDAGKVRTWVGAGEIGPTWFGRFLRVTGLKPGDVVDLRFPIVQTTEQYTLASPYPDKKPRDRKFTLTLRGNTLVRSDPPLAPEGYPFYRRDHLIGAERAPTRKVARAVTRAAIRW